MALSRSAARTARQRRYLWALTACGGAAGLAIAGGHVQEEARERGQTAAEYAQDRLVEATDAVKKTTGVAGPLLHTALSAVVTAVQRQDFDSGRFRADMAATVADLAAAAPTRRHLVALGGGYFLDWLLRLAYPRVPEGGMGGAWGGGGAGEHGVPEPGAARSAGAGSSGLGEQPWSTRPWHEDGLGPAPAPGGALGSDGWAGDSSVATPAAPPAAAARLCREAERAVESILQDEVAAGLLLERPGAVPLLLRAVAEGRASSAVAAALAARAAEARAAAEAMTADLQEAMDVLRGRGVVGAAAGGTLAVQCTAAGLLSSWAAGSSANRAKLTGLGLQGLLAEVATAVSGLSDRAALALQWELLRLSRVMAEHGSDSDSHHMAACVMPLLYTAADAAAAGDAAMASYAVDTLAAAVRYGGQPVAAVVASSTMPHLLWQLAEGLGAHHVMVAQSSGAGAADGKEAGGAAADAGQSDGKQVAGTSASTSAGAQVKSSRSWFSFRGGSATSSRSPTTGTSAGSAAGGGGGGGAAAAGTTAPPTAKSRRVMVVQDSAVAASVAAALAELARNGLLPEAQVPRWRDWLLDVMCADGFDPGTSAVAAGPRGAGEASTSTSTAAQAPATSASAGAHGPGAKGAPPAQTPQTSAQLNGRSQTGSIAPAGGAGDNSAWAGQRLPAWLTLPRLTAPETDTLSSSGCASGPVGGRAEPPRTSPRLSLEQQQQGVVAPLQTYVVAALSALSHMPGNHGLQVAHYWLSRLLSELAARTLPYTALVYLEGPRAPQDLIHAVPVLPSYVKTVADALERAADAVADDSPPLPPHLEFDLAGSGLVARPVHDMQPRRPTGSSATAAGKRHGAAAAAAGPRASGTGAATASTGSDGSEVQPAQQQQPQDAQPDAAAAAAAAAAEVAAYRQAAHVVDVVVAERRAADALEALCAIVAPDQDKQRWLLLRGVLPLMHRLARTADDPRVVLQEQGQPGAERLEQEAALEGVDVGAYAARATAATGRDQSGPGLAPGPQSDSALAPFSQRHSAQQQQHQNTSVHPHTYHHHHDAQQLPHPLPRPTQPRLHEQHQQQHQRKHQQAQQQHQQQAAASQQPLQGPQAPPEVPDILSDHEGGPSLCLQRQVARMLALLALLPDARTDLGGAGAASGGAANAAARAAYGRDWASSRSSSSGPRTGAATSADWMPWLRHAATSSDCRLSSNATRALLHMAALDVNAAAATAAVTAQAAAAAASGAVLSGSQSKRAAAAVAAAATAASRPPVFLDGLHLLDPGAPHHWALVRRSAAVAAAEQATLPLVATVAAASAMADVGSGSDEAGLPAGPAAPGAAVARSSGAASALLPAASAPAGLPVCGLEPGCGGATVVAMGCGAASVSGGLGDGAGTGLPPALAPYGLSAAAATASSALGTMTDAMRYLLSRPLAAWSTASLAATPHGAAPATADARPPPPPLPAVAAATVAEPLQHAPRAAAAQVKTETAGAGVDAVSGPSLPPSPGTESGPSDSKSSNAAGFTHRPVAGLPDLGSSGGDGGSASNRSSSTGAGGAPIPAAAMPTYPAPYSDLPPDSAAGSTAAAAAANPDALPQVDVVFVHGIRGGPFITWRKAGVMTRGSAASHMERSACWPSTWLAEDVPGARLLSVEYLAPVSAWEGESLPLEDNVSRVMGQLAAAGVGTGQRPVVFVAHSMGGLLVKEMLARSMDQAATGGPLAALAPSTRGIVFFGTPHFGNGIAAMGWKLRHLPGALPAPSLARLTPGPHLLSLNNRLRELHDAPGGSLRLVSMLEGLPTQLSGVIPRILIVAPDSAYPGFGAALTLPENDHIDCCKPAGRSAPAYKVVLDVVLHAIRVATPGGG